MDQIYANRQVERCKYRAVMPVTDLNLNKPNNYTTFKLDHGDSFYDSRVTFHIQGELKQATGGDYTAGSTAQLVDNFVPFLFSRIELRKHNTLIDSVDHPGITSTIKGLVSYGRAERDQLQACGFTSQFVGGGKFEAIGTLAHLGLGFYEHLHNPMFKGGFEIPFTRAEDNDSIYKYRGSNAGATLPDDGKVEITMFVLRVPLVEYAPAAKADLISELTCLSSKVQLKYKYFQWQCIDKKGVYGSSFNFDITGLYRNVTNPKYIIVGLQTSRAHTQTRRSSRFDHCNLKNISVKINGHRYPSELQNADISSKKYLVLYDQYISFRKLMFNNSDVYTGFVEYLSTWPLFVIDTHHHPEALDRSRNDIQIELDFTTAVDAPTATTSTIAYVIAVSMAKFQYDVVKNTIRMLSLLS